MGQSRHSKISSLLYSSMLRLFFITTSETSATGSSAVVEVISNTINKLTGIFLIGDGDGGGGGGDGSGFWKDIAASNAGVAFVVTAFAGFALAAAVVCNTR
ncbi:hypothetical protein ACH5RR_019842 [Cinchona calisaya]|uniref:Uncharacterized protein n=1 Tax=Cinchona calisaya TaxID=153742 RepID=A0ABD2ZRR4_9GENT